MSTIKEDFIKQMINLACCKTSPNERVSWWKDNSEQLELFLNRGEYLRIKPYEHEFLWLPILKSQKGAIKYLDNSAIAYIKENTSIGKRLMGIYFYGMHRKIVTEQKYIIMLMSTIV